MALITATTSLVLAGAAHNAFARDCSDPRVVVCELRGGAAKSDAQVPASDAVTQRKIPTLGAAEPIDQVDEERLDEEERLRKQQEAESLEARHKDLQRQEFERRRSIANGWAGDAAARRGSSRSESELGFSRSRSELGFDRSESELGR
jgi:hypothetical protein